MAWLPWRKRHPDPVEASTTTRSDFPTDADFAAGWRDWLRSSPYSHDVVEAKRGGAFESHLLAPRELNPAFNVANLYWRPCRGEVLDIDGMACITT
jgi:hypothetical protein